MTPTTDTDTDTQDRAAAFERRARLRCELFAGLLATADVLAGLLASGTVFAAQSSASAAGVVATGLVAILSTALTGLGRRGRAALEHHVLEEIPTAAHAALLTASCSWFVLSLLGSPTPPPWAMFVVGLVFLVSVLLLRAGARATARRIMGRERCLLVGAGQPADQIRGRLTPASCAGWLGLDVARSIVARSDLDLLRCALAEAGADRLVVALPDDEVKLGEQLLSTAAHARVPVTLACLLADWPAAEFENVRGTPVLHVPRRQRQNVRRTVKRTLEVVSAGLGILLCAPLLALIALAVRLGSPGPVLFRQRRIGRRGQEFDIFKFRTMVPDAESLKPGLQALNESDGLFKIADDPRITRTGSLLRRTSLDELPQLLNVLRGEMSFVGPRPLIPQEDTRIVGSHRARLDVRPGMTGHWQILGSERAPLAEMVELDLRYVRRWSLWWDLKILLRTGPYMARGSSM